MAKILMVILCFVSGVNGDLEEVWRVEQEVYLSTCLTMNRIMSGAGPKAAIIVQCHEVSNG